MGDHGGPRAIERKLYAFFLMQGMFGQNIKKTGICFDKEDNVAIMSETPHLSAQAPQSATA